MTQGFTRLQSGYKSAVLEQQGKARVISRESLRKERELMRLKDTVDLKSEMRFDAKSPAVEFIGTGDFAAAWFERQRYNIDVGRDLEPTLYEPLYDITNDPSLPKLVQVYEAGPAAVIFDEVLEGGEVKFLTMGESNYSVRIKHYGVGVEYTKDMEIFNEQFRIPVIERQVGVAHNALLNHIHLNPFLAFSYGAANQTPASAVGAKLEEKTAKTLENALATAKSDSANPRRGPYYLLCAASNRYLLERVLNPVPQQGFSLQSSALGEILGLIVYDGWSGVRGFKTVSYAGVTANKAYLIDVGMKMSDHQSFVKQGLTTEFGNPDVSRFIRAQGVWDTYFGAYANPLRSTEEISLPTS